MSEPAVFVLIRDGKKSYFADRWASVYLFREIMWGPDEFESWVTQLEPLDDWSDDASGGAVVDFDQRTLLWSGNADQLTIPKVASVYERMLQAAWPNYKIEHAVSGLPAMAKAAGVEGADDYDSELSSRNDTVRASAGLSDEESTAEEDEQIGFGDQPHAWLTIIDQSGAVRHRQMYDLPTSLLLAQEGVVNEVMQLTAAEIPPEAHVVEGMWIDIPRHAVGLWGGAATRDALRQVQQAWQGWKVRWSDRGYAEQVINNVSGF